MKSFAGFGFIGTLGSGGCGENPWHSVIFWVFLRV
jgi:hypothetical protein